MRCGANTLSGRQCLDDARGGAEFCAVHKGNLSAAGTIAVAAGAVVGNVLAPGIGGALLGGIAGHVVLQVARASSPRRKRLFVSFDFHNDRALKDFILGQARHPDAGFQVVNHSLNEAAPEREWTRKARAAIARSDLVLVLVGRNTFRAAGVLKEVKLARAAGVPVAQIIGYRRGDYRPVAGAGRLYSWSRANLLKLLG